MLSLSRSQLDLLSTLSASYTDGLATSDASRRRSDSGGVLNVVLPPINCPKWVCCLLPCIKSIPSMKLFRQIEPEDAEVMRDGRWVRYDAASLVKGDIVRLSDGDAVPADCVVLSLGMDHAATGGDGGEAGGGRRHEEEEEDLEVDHQSITGCPKPSTSSPETSEDGAKSSAQSTRLYYGGRVLRGSCIAVVTAIGPSTALAKLIRDGRWPPKGDLSGEIEAERTEGEDDDEANISLIDRAA